MYSSAFFFFATYCIVHILYFVSYCPEHFFFFLIRYVRFLFFATYCTVRFVFFITTAHFLFFITYRTVHFFFSPYTYRFTFFSSSKTVQYPLISLPHAVQYTFFISHRLFSLYTLYTFCPNLCISEYVITLHPHTLGLKHITVSHSP
jgi:hypothetical protein